MIIPAWIIDNEPTDNFIRCYLGSEPPPGAFVEELPRACLLQRPVSVPPDVYAFEHIPPHLRGYVFTCLMVDMALIPAPIWERIMRGLTKCPR